MTTYSLSAEARKQIEAAFASALTMWKRCDMPRRLDDALTWVQNDQLANARVEAALALLASLPEAPDPTGTLQSYLDGGDASRAGEKWITDIARAVGREHGRIERFNGHLGETGADNHTVVLWDGPTPRACYMVLRDDFNRAKLLLWERGSAVPCGVSPPEQPTKGP
jgi:hypothetical protein